MPGNNYPNFQNAMCLGLVGKGAASELPINLHTMLKRTAGARANGSKLEGVDPYTSIDSTKEDILRLADKIAGLGLAAGSVVAPSGRR